MQQELVDKFDADKLVPVLDDLSKLSDIVKNRVIKKDVYNAKMKNIEKDTIPDINNFATNAFLNTKKMRLKVKQLVLLTYTRLFYKQFRILSRTQVA